MVRRTLGGSWETHDLPDGAARVVLRSGGVQMFPPETVYKRLTDDEFAGVAGYCRALRAIISRQESGREDSSA